ncbi:MAG: VOC family protein [Boseongicola sp. SB0670_bin_30]|nr:VOC family protein [Boseongicola sp. SB0670_bin_30]
MTENNSIRTCLWFDGKGLEAAKFYVSLIPNSELHTPDTDDGEPLLVSFTLGGVPYEILNGGPHYKLNPACSIAVTTPDQVETDRIWDALVAKGGSAGQCGWLVDRWGVSWQVYPRDLPEMLGADDREAAARAQKAMLGMSKIDVAAMRSAFEGNSSQDTGIR